MPALKDPKLDFAFIDFVFIDFPLTRPFFTTTIIAYNFIATLAETSKEFKKRLLKGY